MTNLDAELQDLVAMHDEELIDELKPYVFDSTFGKMLQSPLVYDVPLMMPGLANRRHAAKKKALDAAIAFGDYSDIIYLHERPWRLQALLDYVVRRDSAGDPIPLVAQPSAIARLAMHIWMDSENISQHQNEWLNLFAEAGITGNRDTLLVEREADYDAYDALPDEITVYRGGGEDSFLSWTWDRSTAEFFANRFASDTKTAREVREAVIPKSSVFAVITGRGESELLSWEGVGR